MWIQISMSQARLLRQAEKIARLKGDIKDLKKRMKNCKELEDNIQEYLDTLELVANSHFRGTLDKVKRQYLKKSNALSRVELLVSRLSNMWQQIYDEDNRSYGRQWTNGRTSPTGSNVVTDWESVEAMIDLYIELLDDLKDMLIDENAVLNELFNQVSRNWTRWYRQQKSLKF